MKAKRSERLQAGLVRKRMEEHSRTMQRHQFYLLQYKDESSELANKLLQMAPKPLRKWLKDEHSNVPLSVIQDGYCNQAFFLSRAGKELDRKEVMMWLRDLQDAWEDIIFVRPEAPHNTNVIHVYFHPA